MEKPLVWEVQAEKGSGRAAPLGGNFLSISFEVSLLRGPEVLSLLVCHLLGDLGLGRTLRQALCQG